MNESFVPNVLLIGGPDAGKSNFLFRFWIAVDSEMCALVKNGFPDDLQYLQAGSESLLNGEFAGRTSGDVLEHASIPVRLAIDPTRTGLLNVPDVPGEKILEVYRLRQWTDAWESRISPNCGCLLFVRAGSSETVAPLDYEMCLRAFGGQLSAPFPEEFGPTGTRESEQLKAPLSIPETNATAEDLPPTLHNETPTDVILTEWLQFLRSAFTAKIGGAFRPRVGIVVSAWDALPEDQQHLVPFDYLSQNFPLLAQFVATNSDRFEFEIFGVSILSGDLTQDQAFRTKFVGGRTHEFGYVIYTVGEKRLQDHDVTLPVAWALGWHPLSEERDRD